MNKKLLFAVVPIALVLLISGCTTVPSFGQEKFCVDNGYDGAGIDRCDGATFHYCYNMESGAIVEKDGLNYINGKWIFDRTITGC